MNGGHYCLVSVVLLLWISSWASLSVSATVIDVRRIPGEPVQLESGDSVVLICTVTTDTVTAIQWFNGTTPLQGNSDGVIITLPYRLNNVTWQSAMEVVVLTVHSTGWYFCNPDQMGYGNVRLNVLDAGDDYTVVLSSTDASIYATVPFTIQCTSTLPKDNHLQIEVLWFRNDDAVVVSPLDSVVHTEYINSTTLDSQLTITEQLPAPEVQYKCALKAFTPDTVIYTIEKSTAIQEIKVAPSLDLTVESIPAVGPVLDSSYILTCIGTPSINASVSLRWQYPDGTPVLSGGYLLVEEAISVGNGSRVSLMLSEISGEVTYVCYGSMELYEYSDHIIESTLAEIVVAPVQVMSVSISALPSDTLDWYEGSDAALICTIHTNRPTVVLTVEWHNSHGIIDTSNSPVASFSDNTVHQSILELKSLTVHNDVYYCKASILGAGTKQDWHYVNVESDIPFTVSLVPSLSHIPTAGMSYSLVCSSNKPNNIVAQPTVTWSRSGAIKQSLSDTVVDSPVDNGTHFNSELHFVSIGYTDAGKYTCEVEYDFFGSGSTVRISDPYLLEVKVPSPTASIAINQGGLVCTVRMSHGQLLLPSVNIAWYLTSDSNTNVIASSIPGIAASDVSVLECNELYEAVLSFSDFRTEYMSVTCGVNVSVEIQNTLNSLSDITVNFQNLQGRTPFKPSNVAIRDRGSRWGEISWTSFDSDVNADSFIVQYQHTSNNTAVVLSTNRVYSSSDGSTYSAIVTDLSPATEYSIQVTVHSGANTNMSEEIRFTTNNAVPTGAPLNLSRSYSQDGELILQWSPPKAYQRNGVITGYSVSCDPSLNINQMSSNGSVTTPHTNVSLHELAVRIVYECSVAAINNEGVGPVASLQFSLSADDTAVEGVTELSSMWGWSMILAIAFAIFGVILLIIIAYLAVSVFYYRRKFKSYFQHVCSGKAGLPSSPSDSLRRTDNRSDEDTLRYVPSDAIGEMFDLEWSHRYTPVRRQSSTIPLQEELKHMESEI